MKPTDLSGLIKALMVVIGIALALGRLDALKRWAAHEAFPGGNSYYLKTKHRHCKFARNNSSLENGDQLR